MPKSSHFRWFIIVLLFFITIVNYIDRAAIAFAIEEIAKDNSYHTCDSPIFKWHIGGWHLSCINWKGYILGAFGLGYAVTTFLGGIWVDKLKPKVILAVAVIFWAISMFSTALATGFILLFLSRIILGLAEGPNFPALTRAVADWLPAQERVKALSYALIAVPLALAIGGPIVSQLIIYLTWRGMFEILGTLALLWLPLWFVFFKNSPKNSSHVNSTELETIQNKQDNVAQLDKKMPTNAWRYLLTNKTLLANYWAFFVFGYYLFFFMTWLPEYLRHEFRIDITQQGLFTVLPWLLAAIFLWIVGQISDVLTKRTNNLRISRSYPIIISQLLASLFILPIIFLHNPHIGLTITLISLAVACSMSANANYYAINIDIAKERSGTALGIMDTGFALSGFLAPVITGYIVSSTHSYTVGFILLVALGLSSVMIVALFHHPDETKQ